MKLESGSIVCLNGARIEVLKGTLEEGKTWTEELGFGLFRLIEHEQIDRAAFIHESGWWIVPADDTPDDEDWGFIADWDLWAETDPRGYANHLRDEREAQFAAEDADLMCDKEGWK